MTVENNLSHTKRDYALNTDTYYREWTYFVDNVMPLHSTFKRDIMSFIIQFLLKSISDFIFGIKLHLWGMYFTLDFIIWRMFLLLLKMPVLEQVIFLRKLNFFPYFQKSLTFFLFSLFFFVVVKKWSCCCGCCFFYTRRVRNISE